ncbi:MAG: hypothetical protein GYB64_05080 [Chloroflexi bacterium]|nr:hypothetical protein [Chloroflexota bacterium]
MQRVLNFLAGLLIGALIGALLGILLAPSSGEELRDDISQRAEKVVSDVRSAIEQERERLETELEALKKGEIQVA